MYYNRKNLDTVGAVFEQALEFAKNNNIAEGQYFMDAYIEHIKECNPTLTYEECANRAKANFGYFAGYYSNDVQELMRKFYNTYHPIFG